MTAISDHLRTVAKQLESAADAIDALVIDRDYYQLMALRWAEESTDSEAKRVFVEKERGRDSTAEREVDSKSRLKRLAVQRGARDGELREPFNAVLIGTNHDGVWCIESLEVPGLHLAGPIRNRGFVEDAIKRLERDNRGREVSIEWLDDCRLRITPL